MCTWTSAAKFNLWCKESVKLMCLIQSWMCVCVCVLRVKAAQLELFIHFIPFNSLYVHSFCCLCHSLEPLSAYKRDTADSIRTHCALIRACRRTVCLSVCLASCPLLCKCPPWWRWCPVWWPCTRTWCIPRLRFTPPRRPLRTRTRSSGRAPGSWWRTCCASALLLLPLFPPPSLCPSRPWLDFLLQKLRAKIRQTSNSVLMPSWRTHPESVSHLSVCLSVWLFNDWILVVPSCEAAQLWSSVSVFPV